MEAIGELATDQQLGDNNSGSVSVSPTVTVAHTDPLIISPQQLSPSRTGALAVSVANMIDSSEFRAQMPDPTYQTLTNGCRPMSPYSANTSTYTTLTPLQPLPPISTVSDKFAHATHPVSQNVSGVSGTFTLMQNQSLGMDVKPFGQIGVDPMKSYRYDQFTTGQLGMNMGGTLGTSPVSMMPGHNTNGHGYGQPQSLPGSYAGYTSNQNGNLPSPKQETKPVMGSPNSYDPYSKGLYPSTPGGRLHSPNPMMTTSLNGLNGFHPTHTPSPHSHHASLPISREHPSPGTDMGSKHEIEEINTKELAQKISSELKRYSIPQAVFAQRVLCRSQGTLSDLLRNPKPWSKLKSGRETFRRMWKWLQEPEFQRMSALRLAGNHGK